MLLSPEFWVGVSFVIFVLLMINPVKNILLKKLDERSLTIKSELDAAEDIRHQANKLLLHTQEKEKTLSEEVNKIIKWAEQEVDAMIAMNNQSLSKILDRKNKVAKQKIESAEQELVKSLHSAMLKTIIQSVQVYLVDNINADTHNVLFENALKSLEPQLFIINK